MRDIIDQTSATTNYWKRKSKLYPFTYHGVNYEKRTFRDDPITPYMRGDGFRFPSPYSTFHGTCTNHTYYYEWYAPDVRHAWGTSAASDIGGRSISYYGCTNVNIKPEPAIDTSLRSEMGTKILGKLVDGNFNIAVALAEMRETLQFIRYSSDQINTVRDLIRGRRYKAAAKRLNVVWRPEYASMSIAELWLAWKYGWVPLLQDIFGALNLLINGWTEYPPLVEARARVKRELRDPLNGQFYWHKMTGKVYIGMETKLFYTVEDAWLARLNGLGLLNPLHVAWEAVPFSFVVDWFVPVGAFLEALTAPIGLKLVTGYETAIAKCDIKLRYARQCAGPNLTLSGTPERLDVKHFCMKRNPIGVFPSPGLYLKNGFSTSHVLTTLALIKVLR